MTASVRWLVVAVLVAGIGGPVSAEQFGFLRRGSRNETTTFRDPAGRFSLAFPKDWRVIGGAGDVVVTFSEEDGEAAVLVERMQMNMALAAADVTDVFAELESDALRQRQPRATDVAAAVVDRNDRRIVVIDYGRPALVGDGTEQVRQYSWPVGDSLFRITCSAQTKKFADYEEAFERLIDSFGPADRAEADADAR